MIANLPMYHRAELAEAHDIYWELIRKHLTKVGIESPEKLSQSSGEMDVWIRPDLVFSQTCSMPYRTVLHDKVTLIGTPDFSVYDCPPGYYRSAFVVHKSDTREKLIDFKNAKFAFNMEISQSGFVAARSETLKYGFFFKNRICASSHLNAAHMIANDQAEIASIDAVSLALMERYDSFFDDLKIIHLTTPTPSLPYITAGHEDADIYFNAVAAAIDDLPAAVAKELMIKTLIRIPKETYLTID